MKIKLGRIFTALLVVVALRASAQQDPQFSHYMFTKLYYNPAYAGLDDFTSVSLLHRSQWLAYEANNGDPGGAPSTQHLAINHGLRFGGKDNKAGIGLSLINDRLGPLSNLSLKLSYAHHLDLRTGKLSVGLKGGFWNSSLHGEWLRPSEANDPIIDQLGGATVSQLKPDFSLGVWYQDAQDKYYLGISVNHLVRSDFDFGVDPSDINTKLVQHMYISGGYNITLNNTINLLPSFVIQSDLGETNWNLGLLATYDTKIKNEYWLGLTFRQSIVGRGVGDSGSKYSLDDLVFIAGIGMLKDANDSYNRLKLSYSFDLVSSGVSAKQPTSHEIMFTYILPSGFNSGPPPLHSPRYKHPK